MHGRLTELLKDTCPEVSALGDGGSCSYHIAAIYQPKSLGWHPAGKATVYMAAAGIAPSQIIPVTIVSSACSCHSCDGAPHDEVTEDTALCHIEYTCELDLQDVGCETEVRADAFYAGLPQRRQRGETYDALVDETIGALRNRRAPWHACVDEGAPSDVPMQARCQVATSIVVQSSPSRRS